MPQSAAVRAAHEDDLPLLRREGNPRSHDFNSATLRVDVGTGKGQSGDRVAIAAYLGWSNKFDTVVADFTETDADVTGRDHAALTPSQPRR
jgi:hypothetical protein